MNPSFIIDFYNCLASFILHMWHFIVFILTFSCYNYISSCHHDLQNFKSYNFTVYLNNHIIMFNRWWEITYFDGMSLIFLGFFKTCSPKRLLPILVHCLSFIPCIILDKLCFGVISHLITWIYSPIFMIW